MKKIDKLKRVVGILMLVILIVIIVYALLIVLPNNKKNVSEVEKIKFDYVLYDRDSDIYKDVFEDLKSELSNEEINYSNYAEYISKLFIIDLYTLNNKLSKDDVGGVQFVKDEIRDNFELNVSRTMYKYINVGNKNALPEVSNIEIVKIDETTYKIDNKEYEGYEVSLKWEYKKDLGYDNEGLVYIIKDNDELFVVEKK